MPVGLIGWSGPALIKSGWFGSAKDGRSRLTLLGELFDTVEVDSTFYAFPEVEWAFNWLSVTPANFTFTIKCPATFSFHPFRAGQLPPDLRPADLPPERMLEWYAVPRGVRQELWRRFRAFLDVFAGANRLACLLVLLPATLKFSRRLWTYLSVLHALTTPYRLALEVRNPAWLQSPTLEALARHCRRKDIALVGSDSPQCGWPLPPKLYRTARWGTVTRFLGRRQEGIYHEYARDELARWAETM